MPNPYGPETGPVTNWGDYYARQARSIAGSGSFPWPRQPGGASPILPGRTEQQVERERRVAELEAQSQQRSEFERLMKKEVLSSRKVRKKKLRRPKNPLLDFQQEQAKANNPEFARLLEAEVGKELEMDLEIITKIISKSISTAKDTRQKKAKEKGDRRT